MPFKTYYERLSVAADASQEEIKAAYRKLAQELHPDKLPNDISPKMEELARKEFNELREAYLVLSNPTARSTYDRRLLEQTQTDNQPTTPAQNKGFTGDRIPKRWHVPLAAAAIGAACAVIVVSIVNAVASINRQPIPLANSPSATPGLVAVDNLFKETANDREVEGESTSEVLALSNTNTEAEHNVSDSNSTTEELAEGEFTPGEITRFATALLELQPILNSTKESLEAVSSPEERQEIENAFDVRATQILLSHGLQPDEYQRIAARTETDSKVRLEVITATVRLQQLGRYQ